MCIYRFPFFCNSISCWIRISFCFSIFFRKYLKTMKKNSKNNGKVIFYVFLFFFWKISSFCSQGFPSHLFSLVEYFQFSPPPPSQLFSNFFLHMFYKFMIIFSSLFFEENILGISCFWRTFKFYVFIKCWGQSKWVGECW